VKAAKRDLYRRLVLEAAEAEFATRGYSAARIQDIAAGAGVSLGTLYNNFDGKADIYQSVHEWRLRELLEVAGRAAGAQGLTDVRHTILSGLRVFIEWLVEHRHYLHLNLVHGASWAASPRARSEVEVNAWREGISMMSSLLAAGQAQGVVVDGDPMVMARLLSAAQQVYISAWSESDSVDPSALISDVHLFVGRCFFVPEPKEST